MVITNLFPALRTRLQNQLGNIPSDRNVDRAMPDGNADEAAKDNADGQDVEGGGEAAGDDADGKTATSRSTDRSEAKSGETTNKQGRGKGKNKKGRQAGQCDKNESRGGKGEANGEAKPNKTNGKTSESGITSDLANRIGSKLALALLVGLGLTFSDKAYAMYGLSDMYRLLLSMCCREGNGSSVNAQCEISKKNRWTGTLVALGTQ